jgi:hypothetical protein
MFIIDDRLFLVQFAGSELFSCSKLFCFAQYGTVYFKVTELLDPEKSVYSTKADLYSFGITLMVTQRILMLDQKNGIEEIFLQNLVSFMRPI